ncbi:MAG TPA: ABC transporter permease [Chthonomonadaceae bacterium]|nr:ABC transporter permease [Chthonomonadaceae bacterium]
MDTLQANTLTQRERGRLAPRRIAGALRDNIFSAFDALRQNWLRSLLTMTGIIIGVLSIVTLVAILHGVKAEIARQVEGLGANLVLVVPSKLDENGQMNPAAMIGFSTLTQKDVDALQRVPGVAKLSPVCIVSGTVDLKSGKSASAFIVATNRDGVMMNPTPLAEGRYFDDTEGNVCVLADRPRHDLFGNGPAVGQTVRIRNREWKVVGVLGKPDNDGTLSHAMLGLNTLIYLPISTTRRQLPGGQINRIVLKTDYRHPAEEMITALNTALLTAHHGKEDFGVITQKKGLALVFKLLNMAEALLVLIAAISMFVAGVGIMNIMLVAVTERTHEIGLRKAVGARRVDIFEQFLTEAIVLALVGGGVGLLLSQAICTLIGRYSPLTPQITAGVVGMALGVCILVGLLFGVTPAVRAARLNPIDALRHE